MKLAALLSGGKDSIYSIYLAKQKKWEVTQLITLNPKNKESFMFHSINTNITELQSKAMNIPLTKKETPGEKEKELTDLKKILKKLDIDGVISGAIASQYQYNRIKKICDELGIKSLTPIWQKKQELVLKQQIKNGLKIIIVGVFAEGLDENWLGREIDKKSIDELIKINKKYGINIAGEGGEYETLVLDAPIFTKKIVIDKTRKKWKRDHGFLYVQKAHLEEKKS